MNFFEILNNVIAGLICSGTVAVCTFTYKILRNKYEKDSTMFLINLNFYLGLTLLISSCLEFNIKILFTDFFSTSNIFNLFFFVCIVSNLINILVAYKNIKKYIEYRTKQS